MIHLTCIARFHTAYCITALYSYSRRGKPTSGRRLCATRAAESLACNSRYSPLTSAKMLNWWPVEDIITTVGDPASVAQDLPPTIHMDVTPPLESATATPNGVRFVAVGLAKESCRMEGLLHHAQHSSPLTQPKLLTHYGHGNISNLHSDIPPGRAVSTSRTRATILRITGAPCLGRL
jgi:hypothetical protein